VKYNPDIHRRRSIRLRGYAYSQAGAYFVTICVHNRKRLFGETADGKMVLNDAGRMVQTIWDEIPNNYNGIETNEFIVMPDHIHGIIVIVGAAPCGTPDSGNGAKGQPRGVDPTLSLPDVVHRYKTMTTKRYVDGVKQHGWPPFPRKLWQRNYYEHVIRNEGELNRIREYIINNPSKGEFDRENPGVSILEPPVAQWGSPVSGWLPDETGPACCGVRCSVREEG